MSISIPFDNQLDYIQYLCNSFEKWTGKSLIQSNTIYQMAHELYHAPFVVVAHGTQQEPIFNFANLKAQELWELDWIQFTQLPSRLSAEPLHQSTREQFMKEVTQNGFVSNYEGIRISATGKRFMIKNAIVWNILNDAGEYQGQAAMFREWDFL